MKTKLAGSAFAVIVVLAPMQPAIAQGPAGGTGAIASIPSSVYRAAEQARPVTQPGILGIIASPPPPSPDVDSKQAVTRRGRSPTLAK
jgi:hypothetical protein